MTYQPQNFNVWAELPVTDMQKAMAFYSAVTGAEFDVSEDGPNPMAVFRIGDFGKGTSGHLYPGKPAAPGTGPTVHLAVPGTVEEAMERVKTAGGQVVSPVITIPAGRFAYCLDLDGNSFGCFEAA